MSKKFNIHDWQAKQHLVENDEYQKRQDAMTPGKNPDFFYDDDSIFGKLRKDPDYIKKINAKATADKSKEKNIDENLNPEVSRNVNKFIKAMADRYKYSEQDAVFAIMAALKQRDFDGLDEHHAGDYNPGFLKQSVSTFLDKLKKKTDEGPDYETVEKIMEKHFSAKKEVDEASMTGTGASFNAGSGEGYMSPYAFKKKKKK